MIMPWMAPGMQNFVAIVLGVFAPQIRDFDVLQGLTIVFNAFWVLATRYSLHPWTNIYVKYVK